MPRGAVEAEPRCGEGRVFTSQWYESNLFFQPLLEWLVYRSKSLDTMSFISFQLISFSSNPHSFVAASKLSSSEGAPGSPGIVYDSDSPGMKELFDDNFSPGNFSLELDH